MHVVERNILDPDSSQIIHVERDVLQHVDREETRWVPKKLILILVSNHSVTGAYLNLKRQAFASVDVEEVTFMTTQSNAGSILTHLE